MGEWIVLWFFRQLDKLHIGLSRRHACFFNITGWTGANDIFPCSFSSHASWYNMIQGQLAGREALAAILAPVFVACEDIPSIEFYLVSRQTVVKKQPYNTRHSYIEIHGRYPVVAIGLENLPELAHLAPAIEIVVGKSPFLERNNLSKVTAEQRKCSFGTYNAYRHVMPVQH